MENFLTSLPTSPIGWIGLGIGAVATAFAAYLWYNRQKDGADDRLINILKETVDALETKVDKQKTEHDENVEELTKKIDDLTVKVEELEQENGRLVEILQGRDKATLEFQKQMLQAVQLSMETNGLAKETALAIHKLTDLISAHIVAIETADGKGWPRI